MNLIAQILAVTDAHASVSRLSDATLSTRAFGDGNKLPGVRNAGKDIRTRTFERGLQWFSDNWPEGAVWPEKVMRPAPSPSASSPRSDAGSAS